MGTRATCINVTDFRIDALGNLLQEEMMTHVIEVGLKIQIDHARLTL